MSACLLIGGKQLVMATTLFTLSWTHSVEKTEWHEQWRVVAGGLALEEARVRGSGAGMDPGEEARLEGGWWVWSPSNAPIERIVLAASGATDEGWQLCHADGCLQIGADAGPPIAIGPCEAALPGRRR